MPEANALSAMGAYSRNERCYFGRNAVVSESAAPREPAATDCGAEGCKLDSGAVCCEKWHRDVPITELRMHAGPETRRSREGRTPGMEASTILSGTKLDAL